MPLVREIGPDDWRVLRDIRLTALGEVPDVFGSSYAREAPFTEADWRGRLSRGCTFLAYIPEVNAAEPIGLVSGLPVGDPEVVELLSMWVRPAARGRGAGEALVAAVLKWAADHGAASVHLWVTVPNEFAQHLYKRCGFMPTGECQPLPSNPAIEEFAMSRSI